MILEQKFWEQIDKHAVWELTSTGQRIDSLLTQTDAAKAEQAKEWLRDLYLNFSAIEKEVLAEFGDLPWDGPESAIIDAAMLSKHSEILFTMLDGQNYASHIWKLIEPRCNDVGE